MRTLNVTFKLTKDHHPTIVHKRKHQGNISMYHKTYDIDRQATVKNLTHKVPVLPSNRNQSIDLQSKSSDWFLYEGNTGT